MKTCGRKPLIARVIDWLLKGTNLMNELETLQADLEALKAEQEATVVVLDQVKGYIAGLVQKVKELTEALENTEVDIPDAIMTLASEAKNQANAIKGNLDALDDVPSEEPTPEGQDDVPPVEGSVEQNLG